MFTDKFETRHAGIALSVLLSAALALPAHASGGKAEFNAGYSALLRQDYDRSISHFTDAIETGDLQSSDLALAYHDRGAGYLSTGRYDEAIADFDRAIALNPGLATAFNDRAIAWRHRGNFVRALADYDEAIRLTPRVHQFYLNRGVAYAAEGQYEAAIADYKVALRYKADSVPAFVALGEAHLMQGHKDDALAAYRQALRRKSDLLKVYPGVAVKLASLGAAPPANMTIGGAQPAAKMIVLSAARAKPSIRDPIPARFMIVLDDTP